MSSRNSPGKPKSANYNGVSDSSDRGAGGDNSSYIFKENPKRFKQETNQKPTPVNETNSHSENYVPDNNQFIIIILLARIICFCGWTGGILYSTYQIYLVALPDDPIGWQKDPIMNPGPFTLLLNRGRDTTDFEWTTFTAMFFGRLMYWYTGYVIISSVIVSKNPKMMTLVSISASFLFLGLLIGWLPTLFILSQPFMFWGLLWFRSRLIIWGFTLGLLYAMQGVLLQVLAGNADVEQYYFVVTAAWNCSRCVSYAFDCWDRPKSHTNSLESLYAAVSYCFYFPLVLTGPLILFDNYEKNIHLRQPKDESPDDLISKLIKLMKTLFRLFVITVLNELLLHFLYFRPLIYSLPALRDSNLWVICGIVYWLGQFFSLKYKVMYGFPTCIAEFEGLPMPPLPKCPAYLHRYSVLWKDFDRGLYCFLIRYVYLPTINFVDSLDPKKAIHMDLKKLVGSFVSFCYIYVWHSISFEVLVWAGLNFLGITIEKIGSFLKRKIDSEHNVYPIMWDFYIEPIVTVPLAAMSILNSSVFCGNLESAQYIAHRLWTQRADSCALVFLYFFTQLAVALRTWDQFWSSLRKNPKFILWFPHSQENLNKNKQ